MFSKVQEKAERRTHLDFDFLGQITLRNSSSNDGNRPDLTSQIAAHLIDVICQFPPDTFDTRDFSHSTQFALTTYFQRYTSNLAGKSPQLKNHSIDSCLEIEDFSVRIDFDLFG